MTQPYPYDPAAPVAISAGPTPPPPRDRHPLGLPPGSVRALLILMVMGTIWVLLLMPANVAVPLYLWYLLFLTTGAYFAGRAQTRDTGPPPLYLPRGSIRSLIIVGFFGIIGYAIFKDPSGFVNKPMLSPADKNETLLLPTVMVGAFLLGVIVNAACRKVLHRPDGMPAWYQDVQAWVSVLAVLGLGAQVILELIVFPSMASPPTLPHMQIVLSSIIAFYFGART
ncbi:hypothetical protein AYO44_02020 [Planctomycetaceae bacterium SCGC AG-212-F19]|nr:hypothetical protein AYO44_02020 [Planctomycetaceae bacterium SCGC AG-212-F19]